MKNTIIIFSLSIISIVNILTCYLNYKSIEPKEELAVKTSIIKTNIDTILICVKNKETGKYEAIKFYSEPK